MSTSATATSFARRALTASGVLLAAVVVVLLGTGATYALWNGNTTVNASQVTSGSTSLTVNGGANLNLNDLGPGHSSLTPITLVNTGSSPLHATVTDTVVAANALTNALTFTLTPSATCTAGLTGGVTGPMSGFKTTTPYPLAVGASMKLCLEVTAADTMPVDAAATPFTMNFNALQVRS